MTVTQFNTATIAQTPNTESFLIDGARTKARVFSGMQPTGVSHLGNYLGAIRNWVTQQNDYDSVFCVVDLHALSLPIDRDTLSDNILALAASLLAAGIDPERAILFVQSDVREHTELYWLLCSVTQFGELRRMTQFKDKSDGREDVSASLFAYPVLQAADIILYDTDLVPVGDDQRQHIELTRDVAARFNHRYGETFVLPKADIKEQGARVMALDDPTKKMSKSSKNANSFVSLTDDPDTIRRKVRRAVTDSGSDVRAVSDKPALTNLIDMYALLSGDTVAEIEGRYAGRGYGAFKSDLAEVIVTAIDPIQRNLNDLLANPDEVRRVLGLGAERAAALASAKMTLVRERMGIGSGIRP